MKAFKLSNVFTVVVFILTNAVFFEAQATCSGNQTKEACVANKISAARSGLCNIRNFSGTDTYGQQRNCIESQRDIAQEECGECTSQSDLDSARSRCDGLYTGYNDATKKTRQECAKSGVASINACIEATNRCTGMYAGISNSNDTSNPFAGLINLMTPTVSTGTSTDCTLEEDADKKQQKADKIQQMRDEQQDSVTAQAELDGQIADKQKEVSEEIRKNKDEIQQSMRDLDKEDREKFAAIQKAMLESKKKKFKNLISINKTNTEIANLEFAQQQTNIEFSESKIARKCYDKVMEIKNKLVPQAAPAVPGQPPAPPAKSFTLKEAQRIKQQLRDEESDCLKTERLSRTAQLKGKIDRRQELTDSISQANQDIADDDAAIKLDQDDYDKFKASMAAEKQSKLDSQTQMEANLNASLTAFQALVAKKKAALDAKIANREKAIQELIAAKAEQKQRYSEVAASLGDRSDSLSNFKSVCCPTSGSRRSSTGGSSNINYTDPNCEQFTGSSGPSLTDPYDAGGGVGGQN